MAWNNLPPEQECQWRGREETQKEGEEQNCQASEEILFFICNVCFDLKKKNQKQIRQNCNMMTLEKDAWAFLFVNLCNFFCLQLSLMRKRSKGHRQLRS